MFRPLLTATAFTLGVFALTPAAHAGPEAEAIIQKAADQLSTGTFSKAELAATLDTPRIARFTLGKYARVFSAADLSRFTEAFEGYLHVQLQQQAADISRGDVRVVGSTDRTESDSVVETEVTFPGEGPMTIRWRVMERDGDWRVVDVEAYGVWLAIEQRAQLAAILGRGGADAGDAIAAVRVDAQYAGGGAARERTLAK